MFKIYTQSDIGYKFKCNMSVFMVVETIWTDDV